MKESESEGTFSSIFGGSTKMISHEQIAEQLLKEGFLLTALEYHTELLENGRELKVLKEFFANSKNFSCQENVTASLLPSPETPSKGGKISAPGTPATHRNVSRSGSQMTLDSIDQLTRYSEDTDRKEDEKMAILQYELRTARETISQLRAELAEATVSSKDVKEEHGSDDAFEEEEDVEIKPHVKKFLNFIVNDYLIRNGYKFTAVTFSDECDGQNFDDWEEVGITNERPPTLFKMFKNSSSKSLTNMKLEEETQTENDFDDDLKQLRILNQNLEEKVNDKAEELIKCHDMLNASESKLEYSLEEQKAKLQELEDEKEQLIDQLKNMKLSISSPKLSNDLHEYVIPEQEREDGDGESIKDEPTNNLSTSVEVKSKNVPANIEEYVQKVLPLIPRPLSQKFQNQLFSQSFPIKIDEDTWSNELNNDLEALLANVLPHLVSNLVLTSRCEVVPLIVLCIQNNGNKKTREGLFNILFNIMKKPDEKMRKCILSGLYWLVNQTNWTCDKIEEEILPHILEQINHKYCEKKILTGQSIAIIASHVENAIRSSLLISLCLQLLEDKNSEVVSVGIKSLTILLNMIDDHDKIHQVHGILLSRMKGGIDEDANLMLKNTAMDVLNIWSMKTNGLFDSLNSLLLEIENIYQDISTNDNNETFFVDDTIRKTDQLMQNYNLLFNKIPYTIYSVVCTCPTTDEEHTLISHENSDLMMIFGDEFPYQLKKFNRYTEAEHFITWKEYEEFMKFLSRLAVLFSKLVLNNFSIIKKSCKLLSCLVEILGTSFSRKLLEKVLTENLSNSSALYSIIFYGYFDQKNEDMNKISMEKLKEWIKDSNVLDFSSHLVPAIKLLCSEQKQRNLLENLFELLKSDEVSFRIESGNILNQIVSEDLSEEKDLIPRMIVPAILSLAADSETQVRKSAIPSMLSLLSLEYLDFEVGN